MRRRRQLRWTGFSAWLLGSCVLSLWPVVGAAAEPVPAVQQPQRIVSLNLCADLILLQLVAPQRIAALSFLSQDPDTSALAAQASALPTVRGQAEEVLALAPDLVLVGSVTTRHTAALLREFNIPVLVVPGASSFEEYMAEVRSVARAVGAEARGEAVIAEFQQRWQALQALHPQSRPVALQYTTSGYTSGIGTLFHDIIEAGGYINGAARAGLSGYAMLPLEKMLEQKPTVLLGTDYLRTAPTLGNRLLDHPAIQHLRAEEVQLPIRETICAGIWNLDAAERLLQHAWTAEEAR